MVIPGQLILCRSNISQLIQNRSDIRQTWSLYIAGIRFATARRSTSLPMDMWTFMIRTAYPWALHFWHMTYIIKTTGSVVSDKNITHQFHNSISWWSLQGHKYRQERNTIPTCTSTCGFTVSSSGWWWKITQKEDMLDVLRRTDKRLQMHWKIRII